MPPEVGSEGTASGNVKRVAGRLVPKAIFLALALLLASGAAPGWVDWLAAAFLWTIVSACLFAIAVSPLVLRDLPEDRVRQSLAQQKTSDPEKRSVLLSVAWRLPLIVAIGALYVSGRPILASLYLFMPFAIAAERVAVRRWAEGVDRPQVTAADWTIFVVFRLLFRSFRWVLIATARLLGQAFRALIWRPLLFGTLLSAAHGGLRLKRSLQRAAGLPRRAAWRLYGGRFRCLWRSWLPWGFWLSCAGLALPLLTGWMPSGYAIFAETLLWPLAIAPLALAILTAFVVMAEPNWFWARPRRRTRGTLAVLYARRILALGACASLYFAGLPLQAGLLALALLSVVGLRLLPEVPDWDSDEFFVDPFEGFAFVVLVCLVAIPLAPIWVPLLVYERWLDFRIGRRLRARFSMPEAFAYLVYAEPHQYERLLGDRGVLAAYRDRVIARDWRHDIRKRRESLGWQRFGETSEGRLLKRFEITDLREDLPFLALVVGSAIKPISLSRSYRSRRRDQGRALRRLEGRIAKVLAKRFGATAS